MNMPEKKKPLSVEEKQVAAYLQDHPDFFSRHPEVLAALYLPHDSGSAVSLIEKQMTVLRERNSELRSQLHKLMAMSKANDGLFTKCRNLVMRLMDARSPEAIPEILLSSFRREFGIEFASLTLLDTDLKAPDVNLLAADEGREKLLGILETDEAICGVLRSQQLIALFGNETARKVGSAVTMRLADGDRVYGVLALGNSDSHYYNSDMDTLFLKFIVDILNRTLYPRL